MGQVGFFDLQSLKNKYNCKFFVETGTCTGDGVEYARQFGFEKVYSIEIFDELAKQSRQRFAQDENVEILHDNSKDGLSSILDKLDGNCIFWLDAHFPGSDVGAKGYSDEKNDSINIPLLDELRVISSRSNYNDVVLMDDLRLFKDVPIEFRHMVVGCNDHWASIGQPEIKRENLVKFNLQEEAEKLFPNKIQTEFWESSGYLCLTPLANCSC